MSWSLWLANGRGLSAGDFEGIVLDGLFTGDANMADKKAKQSSKSPTHGDTKASLQRELTREGAEGADSIGDIGSNRTVTGSSTWETLPNENQVPASPKGKGKASGKRQGSGSGAKKRR